MKPLEIISMLPQWAKASPEEIVDSPAFAQVCRLGEETVTLRRASVLPAESQMLSFSILFGDEPHILSIARSPRFPELDRIWDARADVPEAVLLALVERECGPLLQMLENAVRRQLRLEGTANPSGEALCFTAAPRENEGAAPAVFSLTRSGTVVAALGSLRNLDPAHEAIRSVRLPAVAEYAAFSLPPEDAAGMEIGDAIIVPEIGTVPASLVVDGRFVLDGNGVSRYDAGELVHLSDAAPGDISLGEVFDAAETPRTLETGPSGALKLAAKGRTLATGRLGRVGDQPAFIVESKE